MTFRISRIDTNRGVTAPWMGDYSGNTALQAICSCLQTHTWIAGPEPFASNGTQIDRLNVREWKRHNIEIGADADYNKMVRSGERLYNVESITLIVERLKDA